MPIASKELLVEYLQKWSALHSKQLSDAALEAWLEIFLNTNPKYLAPALDAVTKNAERMPTPGHLTKAISKAREELSFGVTDKPRIYPRVVVPDPETGEMVNAWRDPDTNEIMFNAHDCPEGREFINKLSEIAERKVVPFPDLSEEGMQKERTRQKKAFVAYVQKNKLA